MILDEIIETGKFTVHESKFAVLNEIDRLNEYWPTIVSFYPYYRIYYVTESNASIILREKELSLETGYLYLIPAFQVIGARCNHLSHYYLHFLPESTANNIFEYYRPLECIKADGSESDLFETIITALGKDTPGAKLALHGAFRLLLSRFFADVNDPKQNIARFLPTLKYIEKNIRCPITLADLAETLCLEKVYFANMFRQTFGISPIQYVIGKKIDLARTMLTLENMNIKEVANYLGFENESYFSRLFIKKTSFSPSFYRKNVESLPTSPHYKPLK